MGMNRRDFVLAAGVGVAGCLVGARRAWGLPRRPDATWFEWKQVRDGVYVAVGEGGNTMLLATGATGVLVDTKNAPFGPVLRREAESLIPEKLGLVINTHHHADHTGGNNAFSGMQSIMHVNAHDRILSQFERYRTAIERGPAAVARSENQSKDRVAEELAAQAERAASLKPEDFTLGPGLPSEFLSGMPMPLGSVTLALHHFGAGHTDNDVVVQVKSRNVIHAGDLFFHGRHPYFDPPGGATAMGWIRSVNRIIELCDAETVVIPGHGEVSDVNGLRGQASYLESLVETVKQAIADGKSKEETQALRPAFFEGLGAEQIAPRALGAVYDELTAGDAPPP